MSTAYSISKSKRGTIVNKNDSPGPGGYDDTRGQQIVHEKSPEWSFQKSGREGLSNEGSPGPGYYENNEGINHGTSYTMGSKTNILSPLYNRNESNPGPGQYDYNNRAQSPQYMMGSKRNNNINQSNPGPGQYNQKSWADEQKSKNTSSVAFGSKTQKGQSQGQHSYSKTTLTSPGPGQYSHQQDYNKNKNPSYGFGKGQKGINHRDISPGPGSYQGSETKTIGKDSQRVTMSGRPKTAHVNKTPGPGSYQYNDGLLSPSKSSNFSTMKSKAPRMQQPSNDSILSPGPGAYDAKDYLTRDKSPSQGFTSTQRNNYVGKDESSKPGPGNYDQKSTKNGPSYTMGQKQSNGGKNNAPGPGNYEPNYNVAKDASRSYKMGSANKERGVSKSYSQLPGPGNYHVNDEFGKTAPKFTIKGKPQDQQRNDSPGPAQYDPSTHYVKDKPPTYSIRGSEKKSHLSNTIDVPGPGEYTRQERFGSQTPSYTIGSKRQHNDGTYSPGPGHYDANDNYTKNASLSYRQSSSKRAQMVSQNQMSQPGPGNYSFDNKTIGRDCPSYTIGGRDYRQEERLSPGPGAYEANQNVNKDSIRTFKMGNSQRQDLVSKEVKEQPGPGNYAVDYNQNRTQSYTMQGRKDTKVNTLSPGPGAYNASSSATKDKTVSYKMSQSGRGDQVSKETKQKPGPGSYQNTNEFGKNTNKVSIFGKAKQVAKDNNPGPGNYEANANIVKDKVVSHKMSKTSRTELVSKNARDMPGPGNYESPSRMGNSGPSFSMKSKRQDGKRDKTPGPGSYNMKDSVVKDASRSYRMGKSQRPSIVNKTVQEIPGPGNYESTTKIGKNGPAFTFTAKNETKNKSYTPGPGNYEASTSQVKDRTIGYKMGTTSRADLVSKEAKSMPGPGNYSNNHKEFGKDAQCVTMRGRQQENHKTLSPGPGGYDPSYSQNKDNVVSYKMGSSKRSEMVSRSAIEQPGPGNYDSPSRLGKGGPQYTMGQRSLSRDDNMSPGPGAYEPADTLSKDRTRSYAIGNTQRTDIVSKSTRELPGPGIYDQKSSIGQGPQYTIKSKKQDKVGNDNPGPGQYEESNSAVKDRVVSHKMSKSGRQDLVSKEQKSLPGPGNYSSTNDFGKDVKSFTMRGKPEDNQRTDSPGPGNYEPQYNQTKDSTVGYRMNKSTRADLVSKETKSMPGPGNYSNNHKEFGKDAQSVTMRGRQQENHKTLSPGPGGYDPSYSQNKDNVVSYKMGSSKRSEMVSRSAIEQPGPGNYDSPSKLGKGGPQYTMGQRSLSRDDNMSPGPGTYEPADTLSKDRTRSYAIGNTQRTEIVSKSQKELPGPGIYDQKSSIGQGPSFSMKSKRDNRVGNENPGPGEYEESNSAVKDRVVSHKMSKTERADLVSKEAKSMPGPGNYSNNHKEFGKDAQSVTMRGRQEQKYETLSPGPGGYEPSYTQNKDNVVSYKMGSSKRSEMVSRSALEQPGPGNYDSPSRLGKGGPQYTMGQRSLSREDNMSPGPGAYEPTDTISKDRTVSHVIGKTQRQDIVSKQARDQPGPGIYEQKSSIGQGGPSYSMKSKRDNRVGNQNPGPGEYEESNSAVKGRVVSHKMSKTERADLVSKEAKSMPGPGNYSNNHKEFGKDAQSVTMRGRQEQKYDTLSPGPGGYEPSYTQNKDNVVSYKMGSSKRLEMVSRSAIEQPGPGNYDSPSRLGKGGPKYTMGQRSLSRDDNMSPGPGAYEPTDTLSKDRTVSHQIGTTQRQDIVPKGARDQLGPGVYEQKSSIGQGPSYSMKQKREERVGNDNPGPGGYEESYSATKDRVVSHKMSKSERADIVSKEVKNMPGPGIYTNQKEFGKDCQSFSIRGKPEDNQRNDSPGPGEYEPSYSQVKDKTVAYNQGKGQRSELVSKEARNQPGPGIYESPSKMGSGSSFTIQGKGRDQVDNKMPGPGNYDPKHYLSKDSVTGAALSKTQRADIVSKEARTMPGPGNYANQKEFGQDAQSVTIRGKGQEMSHNDNPGPGNYEPSDSQSRYSSPAYKMSQGQRSELLSPEKKSMPGPGVYDQPSSIGKGSGFKMRGKPSPDRDNGNPGPGQYSEQHDVMKDRIQSAALGKSKRDFLTIQDDIPGPGNYELNQKSSTPSFTIQGKAGERQGNHVPGPGSYDANSGLLKDRKPSANFSSSPLRESLSRSGSPHRDYQPGPGQYDARDQYIASHTSIVYSIPKGEHQEHDDGYPGPGHYKIPVKFADVPRYVLPNQNEEFKYV